MGKSIAKRLVQHFFRGLLFIVPTALTIYVLYLSITWMDNLLEITVPGLGLLIILVAITLLGFLASMFITRPFFEYFEKILEKLPFVNLIYSSLKDLIGAFVGDKKKFDKPVSVQLDNEGNIFKLGFITQTDLSDLGLKDMVCVYLPHSYNFSGNHFIVPQTHVKPLDLNGTSAMKFIVSGGVSGLN